MGIYIIYLSIGFDHIFSLCRIQGEFIFLVGHSGAGKSTLLKILTREEKVSSGRVSVLGQDLSKIKHRKIHEYRRNLGVVFQDYNLFMHMTVLDNLALPYRLRYKTSKDESKRVALELLEQFGLSEHINKYPNECSGGQQQRIAIARALILNPRVLLIDEPTAALDQENTEIVTRLLKELNKKGLTVVVITHDLPFFTDANIGFNKLP